MHQKETHSEQPDTRTAEKKGDTLPKVSCLMVTADRPKLCKRSIRCYMRQTYPNRELVVVDDGKQDLSPVLSDVPSDELNYIKLPHENDYVLGKLRNIALDEAEGEYITQWDDDEWFHPERIERQAKLLMKGHDACCLHATLMHIASEKFIYHPYIGILKDGVPGSIMHRKSADIRYPELARAEDTYYLEQWRDKRFVLLPVSENHLFIRCFHGNNTWEKNHFLRRVRNNVPDALRYFWYRYVRGDLFKHPRFQLNEKAANAFHEYLSDSDELGLFNVDLPR